MIKSEHAQHEQISLQAMHSLTTGIAECSAGVFRAIKALAEDNKQETRVFKKLCRLRDSIDLFEARLNPSILFKNDPPVDCS